METIKVLTDNNQIYKIESQTKSIVIPTTQPSNIELVSSPSKVEIISIPPSSPGPKGDPFLFEDFTPSQLAQITPTVSVGTTTTLPPESDASVTDSGSDKNHILDFGIPQGKQGERGQAATVHVANTITVTPGTPASVINQGSETDAQLVFHIPQGVQGETGQKGEDGISPTIRVGTTTTGQPGSQASVTNSGTAQNAILNFSIPRGAQGNPGPAGRVQDVMVSYDSGETWESALTGNVAEIIMTGGGGGGGGGEINRINKIQKNGVDLPIVNKVVNVPVPTATSDLTNDSGFITASSVPTKVSDLQNDSGFITASDVPQSNWAETDTTSKAYIQNKPTLVTPGSTVGNIVKSYYAENSDFAGTAMQVDLAGVTNADDLKAIEALSGTAGLLRKTGHNTWTLDVTAYAPASSIPQPAVNPISDDGYLTPNNLSATMQMYWAGSQWWEKTTNTDLSTIVNNGGTEQPSPIYGIPTRQAIDIDRLDTYTYYLNQKIASIYATQASIPTKVSDLQNDSGYITQNDVPIESISVNGVNQPIVNKNVDLSISEPVGVITFDRQTYTTSTRSFTYNIGSHPVGTLVILNLESTAPGGYGFFSVQLTTPEGTYIDVRKFLGNSSLNPSTFTFDSGAAYPWYPGSQTEGPDYLNGMFLRIA